MLTLRRFLPGMTSVIPLAHPAGLTLAYTGDTGNPTPSRLSRTGRVCGYATPPPACASWPRPPPRSAFRRIAAETQVLQVLIRDPPTW